MTAHFQVRTFEVGTLFQVVYSKEFLVTEFLIQKIKTRDGANMIILPPECAKSAKANFDIVDLY